MCKVSADHVGLLRVFGMVFLAGIVSIFSGVTYFRRIIRKEEEAPNFWSTVVSLLVIGGGTLVATWACV